MLTSPIVHACDHCIAILIWQSSVNWQLFIRYILVQSCSMFVVSAKLISALPSPYLSATKKSQIGTYYKEMYHFCKTISAEYNKYGTLSLVSLAALIIVHNYDLLYFYSLMTCSSSSLACSSGQPFSLYINWYWLATCSWMSSLFNTSHGSPPFLVSIPMTHSLLVAPSCLSLLSTPVGKIKSH